MDGKKVLGIVLVLLGLFYALAPHAMHVSSGLGFGLEHMWHVTLGVVLLLGSIMNRKTLIRVQEIWINSTFKELFSNNEGKLRRFDTILGKSVENILSKRTKIQ